MYINFKKHITDIEFLLKNYTKEFRATINPYRLEMYNEENNFPQFDVENISTRESLIEHVWTLPILATYFHWYIDDIDLGKVLSILAIHDIWELVIGDEIAFTKKVDEWSREESEALKIINPKHHELYKEFLELKTNEAKFAKSIDKLSPDLYEYIMHPDDTTKRLKHFMKIEKDEIVDLIESHKSPYMQWNTFFSKFHSDLMKNTRIKFWE